MISGPTIPRTPAGVRGLIQRHLGAAERGLSVVVEDLELGDDCEVDALARDAAGAPVLVFGAVPGNGRSLSRRVLNAHTWFRSHGRFLVREYGEHGLDPAARVRLLVLGLDFLADTVRDLQSLGLEDLQVHEFCSFTVGGELRLGVTQLLGGETGAGIRAGTQAGTRAEARAEAGTRDPAAVFQVPSGMSPGPAADRCARFLDLVQRMDPRVTAWGDRFSRQINLGGHRLAELCVDGGVPRVRIHGGGEQTLDTLDDCLAVVDRLVRRLLAAEALPAPSARPSARASAPPQLTAAGPSDPRGGSHEGLDEGRFSLEPIRQSVAAAKVSRDEYSALEDPVEEQ
jgi:hypothetical protein